MDTGATDRVTWRLGRFVSRRATVLGEGACIVPGLAETRRKGRTRKPEKHEQTCGKAGAKPVKGKRCRR